MPSRTGLFGLGVASLLLLAACAEPGEEEPATPSLAPASFADLPGWDDDAHGEALAAFERSCAALGKRPADAALGPAVAGIAADWQRACAAAVVVSAGDAAARDFFETWFQPYRMVVGSEEQEGLFTGYYEPLLQGSRTQGGRYRHPLYGRPPDLVSVDLGSFDATLAGKRVAGRVEGGKLVPYADRAAIDAGALEGRDLELLWVDDPVALFFLHIQGSGQVQLASGERLRVGYADQNGRAYRAIGRDLVEAGELAPEEVSLQTIRAWLRAHPDRASTLMAKNPSYIFFRDLGPAAGTLGPPGAQGVPLTPLRSIAVDGRAVAYGTPIWLDTTAPFPDGERPMRRLVVAQDTGGAIKGPVRGDLFWGAGELAEYGAGHMKHPGRWYILLPKAVGPVG